MKIVVVLAGTLILNLVTMETAWAYLDPGTGSLIVQSLIAGAAGAMVVGRLYWDKLKGFFGVKSSNNEADGLDQEVDQTAGGTDDREQ